jgi:hypothetical protein
MPYLSTVRRLEPRCATYRMLEMHKLTRYEHAPVVHFGNTFDPAADADQLGQWLADFVRDKGRPPKLLHFTFRATDTNADDVCAFMRACSATPAVADVISQLRVLLDFGDMSDAVAADTGDRIMTQRF